MAQIRPLCNELAIIAKNDLNETPERVEESLLAIKTWLHKTPHLRCRTDDQFLVAFLRGCKYSLEKTKRKLDAYYTIRTMIPELMANRDPLHPKTSKLIAWGCGLPLLKTTSPDAPVVSILRSGHLVKCEEFTLAEFLPMCMINIDLLMLHNDKINVAGQVLIVDNDKQDISHMRPTTPADFQLLEFFNKEAIAIRLRCVHLINTSPLITTIFNFAKKFMGDKIRQRFMVHDSLESLHNHVSPSILPKEYGGTNKSVNELTAEWQEHVLTHRQYLLDDRIYGVDESKRQKNFRCADQMNQEISGSFRKLAID